MLVALFSCPFVLYRVPVALVPERWAPVEIHKASEDIAENIKTQDSKLILTLAPLLALEGGGTDFGMCCRHRCFDCW